MKSKTKCILRCMAVDELTEFNTEFNKTVENHCQRRVRFEPTLDCLFHPDDKVGCKYLKIKTYKGSK